MIYEIAYYQIGGVPLVAYMGILTFIVICSTAFIGWRQMQGNLKISFVWHKRLAITVIVLALFHALAGLSLYLRF